MDLRFNIVETFAQWTAFSSTRSGSPVKSRVDVYPLIQLPKYKDILVGNAPVSKVEFNSWHEKSTNAIHNQNEKMNIGWAAKLINVYLKTMVYVGGYGRPNLIEHIHPPIDSGLWHGIKNNFRAYTEAMNKTHSITRIKGILTYQDYENIIQGIEMITSKENYRLIEIESVWEGTTYKK